MKNLARKFLSCHSSNLKFPARLLFFALLVSLICGLFFFFKELRLIYKLTGTILESERLKQSKQNSIAFEKVLLTSQPEKNVRIWQNTRNTRSIAQFQNSIFAATDGGLLQMSDSGEILRHFTVLDGLPESDLTALQVFQSKLFIGSRSQGLLSFDGENFTQFRLKNHETKSITALVSDEKTLLIGTFSGGLLEFDGKNLREIKAVQETLKHITFLQKSDSRMLVGTFHNGLWIRQNDVWKNFTNNEGLLSNRVVGAEIIGEKIFVAADLGISQAFFSELFQDIQKPFQQSATLPTLSSLITANKQILLTKENGEIYSLSVENKYLDASKLEKIRFNKPENSHNAQLFKNAEEIWLLSNQGIWKSTEQDEISLENFIKSSRENDLADNNISALKIDKENRIWLGTFRNGIDIFSANSKKIKHLESETIREINNFSETENTIFAATSGGIARFDKNFQNTTETENLPSRSVMQISISESKEQPISAVATSKGLLFQSPQNSKIFSVINDLPSNSIYTSLFASDSLFVGTLGGLGEIKDGKVVKTYKTSNSELKNNWITALCLADERIFIGTYGGGIYELLPSGEVRSFANETAEKVFVNLNAIYADEKRLFVGTLEGVWMLDLTTQKWSQIKEILPSETVLSIAGNRDFVLFGTTNGIAQMSF